MALTIVHQNPIIVTGTTDAKAAIESSGNEWLISGLYWKQATTDGHKLALQDKNDKEIFEFEAEADGSSQEKRFDPPVSAMGGIYCDDMDSGTLYIYIK